MMGGSGNLDDVLGAIYEGAQASGLEGPALDFKTDKSTAAETQKDVAEAAICFANAEGGLIVLGIRDRPGGPDAFVGTDLDHEHLRKRVWELTTPSLTVEAGEQLYRDVRLVVVRVPPGITVHSDKRGRASRRLNTDCLPMSAEEQARLSEDRRGFDYSSTSAGRTVRDVDPPAIESARRRLRAFSDARSELADLDTPSLLRALGVADQEDRLNVAGDLLFCAPQELREPALVYQYKPTPSGEPNAVERWTPPLLLAVDRMFEYVAARQTMTPIALPDGQQVQVEDFPDAAVREAVVNGLIHRDYRLPGSVHVEHSPSVFSVTSPGPLVPGVTPKNILTHPSKPRNPALTEAVRTLGLAEKLGRGIDRMYREMLRTGREVPRIEGHAEMVEVSLVGGAPNTQVTRFVATLPADEQQDTDTLLVLLRLCTSKTVTATEIAPLLQRSVDHAEVVLSRLAAPPIEMVEPTRETARLRQPKYRLREDTVKQLGNAVPYRRRTSDEIDRRVVEHMKEYGRITNKTVQNLFSVDVYRASAILRDLRERQFLRKLPGPKRGPGVAYAPGAAFPVRKLRPKEVTVVDDATLFGDEVEQPRGDHGSSS